MKRELQTSLSNDSPVTRTNRCVRYKEYGVELLTGKEVRLLDTQTKVRMSTSLLADYGIASRLWDS